MSCGELHKIDGKSVRIENLVCKCGGTKFKMVKREKI
jgi:predicted  nucleic acid-binding Zn-ribbon protein